MAIEAGIADYRFKYVGLNGAIIVGMTTFGESRHCCLKSLALTVDNVIAKAKSAAVILSDEDKTGIKRVASSDPFFTNTYFAANKVLFVISLQF